MKTGESVQQHSEEPSTLLHFIDDNTHYVWVYPLKHKHEVFDNYIK